MPSGGDPRSPPELVDLVSEPEVEAGCQQTSSATSSFVVISSDEENEVEVLSQARELPPIIDLTEEDDDQVSTRRGAPVTHNQDQPCPDMASAVLPLGPASNQERRDRLRRECQSLPLMAAYTFTPDELRQALSLQDDLHISANEDFEPRYLQAQHGNAFLVNVQPDAAAPVREPNNPQPPLALTQNPPFLLRQTVRIDTIIQPLPPPAMNPMPAPPPVMNPVPAPPPQSPYQSSRPEESSEASTFGRRQEWGQLHDREVNLPDAFQIEDDPMND